MDDDELRARLAAIDAEWYATLEQLDGIDVLRDQLDALDTPELRDRLDDLAWCDDALRAELAALVASAGYSTPDADA